MNDGWMEISIRWHNMVIFYSTWWKLSILSRQKCEENFQKFVQFICSDQFRSVQISSVVLEAVWLSEVPVEGGHPGEGQLAVLAQAPRLPPVCLLQVPQQDGGAGEGAATLTAHLLQSEVLGVDVELQHVPAGQRHSAGGAVQVRSGPGVLQSVVEPQVPVDMIYNI